MGRVTVVRGNIREESAGEGMFSCRIYFESGDVEAISMMGERVDLADVGDDPARRPVNLADVGAGPERKPATQMVAATGVAPQAQKGPAEVELEKLIHDPIFQVWASKRIPAEVARPADAVEMAKFFVGVMLATAARAGVSREDALSRAVTDFKAAQNG